MGNKLASAICVFFATAGMNFAADADDLKSIGIEFVTVPAGTFTMGSNEGDWDEAPPHEVTISHSYELSAEEVTLEQYRQFRHEHAFATPTGAVTGVSWQDARDFCLWLSAKEGATHRLPTEAEWEYACRLNGGGPGDRVETSTESGGLGLVGMCDGVQEWCFDWHGEYLGEAQTDPIGPDGGMARVVRGNKLDDDSRFMEPRVQGSYYQRAANRAGMAPCFAPNEDSTGFGQHMIGFRIVRGPMPGTRTYPRLVPFSNLGIRQSTREAAAVHGPATDRPYFRKRYVLPSPPETIEGFNEERSAEHMRKIRVLGLHPSFRGHNHSPAIEEMPNGDLLMVIFTSWNEYEPGMSLMCVRLRFGADQWDMPSLLVDMPDACDNTPLLWTEGDTVLLFFSNTRIIGGFPFNWLASSDSGATWSDIQFPRFTTAVGPHSRQPINTAVRDREGNVYLPSDGDGASSVLWRSSDSLQTWQDMGGRTGGRHTTITVLKDGVSLLGMGGKSSDINGYMPKSISRNGGKTWEVSATQFPAYGSNQRPCVLRLKSGRLFFCGDFQRIDGVSPGTVHERGSFVALSDDDGDSWRIRKLPGAQPHENPERLGGADTIGYSVAREARNGVIHLITTMNKPCLHFALNEAWILSDEESVTDDTTLMANSATRVHHVAKHRERYPDGKRRVEWRAGLGDDGRYLFHGKETWYYKDGTKQYEATFDLGKKVGKESFYRSDGSLDWQWLHARDGTGRWTQWWPNGEKKVESNWRDLHADGPTRSWGRDGKLEGEHVFHRGT